MLTNGKTIAVTGGGNGIGRELALQLLARGARVAALDISESGLAETASLAGDAAERLSTHTVNMADRAAVEAALSAIIEAMEADKFHATIGKDAAMMDTLSQLMPECAAALICKQMKSLLAG